MTYPPSPLFAWRHYWIVPKWFGKDKQKFKSWFKCGLAPPIRAWWWTFEKKSKFLRINRARCYGKYLSKNFCPDFWCGLITIAVFFHLGLSTLSWQTQGSITGGIFIFFFFVSLIIHLDSSSMTVKIALLMKNDSGLVETNIMIKRKTKSLVGRAKNFQDNMLLFLWSRFNKKYTINVFFNH